MRIYEDLRLVQTRLVILQYAIISIFAVMLSIFWYLQVLRGKHYRELAENNQSRHVALVAPRGPMFDRNGEPLVENSPSFNVLLRPEDCHDIDHTIGALGHLLRMGEAPIRERLARRGAPFRPVVIKANASDRDLATVHARRLELPAVEIQPVPLRNYPLGPAAAHALGRVGEITERQLAAQKSSGVRAGAIVGQAGLEASWNGRLMGVEGHRRVIVNSRGVEVREAARQDAVDGPEFTLTLDARLQSAMEAAFGDRNGSAVALDPQTGAVLALVSRPAYDPNAFATGIEPAEWAGLISDPATPLLNRAIQGQYSPGSLFKVISATAALEEGTVTPETKLLCPGQLTIYGTVFHCNVASGHGWVDLKHAIAVSCNVYFYQVGVKLGIERLARYAKRLGLGQRTGIDLPHEMRGLMPDPEWKERATGKPWYAGETVSVAIGQGQVTVTPIQMARVAACVANGGHLVQPHLVRRVGRTDVPPPAWKPTGLRPETLEVVRAGMCAAVSAGTARRARMSDVEVCGKTGSAQVVSRDRLRQAHGTREDFLPHAWFMGFAPRERPTVAFAFLVEHGASGGRTAAPIARKFLQTCFGSERSLMVARAD
jgi:penicillin-binding protein 2